MYFTELLDRAKLLNDPLFYISTYVAAGICLESGNNCHVMLHDAKKDRRQKEFRSVSLFFLIAKKHSV